MDGNVYVDIYKQNVYRITGFIWVLSAKPARIPGIGRPWRIIANCHLAPFNFHRIMLAHGISATRSWLLLFLLVYAGVPEGAGCIYSWFLPYFHPIFSHHVVDTLHVKGIFLVQHFGRFHLSAVLLAGCVIDTPPCVNRTFLECCHDLEIRGER